MKKYLYALIIIISWHMASQAALTIKSDPEMADSFPFPIHEHRYDGLMSRFFVGAHEAIDDSDQKIYAVSYAGAGDVSFIGITPAKVTLDGNDDTENPLHGAKISKLALLGRRPVVIADQEPHTLYVINKFFNVRPIEVLSARKLNDAEGQTTAGIIGLTSNAPGNLLSLPSTVLVYQSEQSEGNWVLAAVKNARGEFGQKGAGVALVNVTTTLDKEKKITSIDIPNAQTGEAKGNKAVPLDIETDVLKINSPVAHIEDTVALHHEFRSGNTYIGLQATSGAQDTDGVRALVRATVGHNSTIELREIAPAHAFTGNDKIIGAVGSNEHVSIHIINAMLTSTWLDYLIVVGGNGDPMTTRDQVFALPLVGIHNAPHRGMIAKKDSVPRRLVRLVTDRFAERLFDVAAEQPEDMPLATDRAARVGGGPLGMPIADLWITLDTVFVATQEPGNGQQAGIFYSQALFDECGRVSSWTVWRRAGVTGSITGLAFDPFQAYFWFMVRNNTGMSNVRRTSFGKISMSGLIEQEFPQQQSGVQGIVEVPHTSAGLSSVPGERLALLLWLGNSKVLMAQIGADDEANNFGPLPGNKTFSSSDGSLASFVPHAEITNLILQGGALNELGPIVAGTLAVCNANGYFVVGGFNGIAVLADGYGNGFDARRGLGSGFFGLNDAFAFKKVGNFRHVRKLIADGDCLYVITNKTIERVFLAPQDIATNKISSVTLADDSNLPLCKPEDSLSDALIINGFALIATSAGVYYASGLDSAMDGHEILWHRVELTDASRASIRLWPLEAPGGFDKHGMVIVLNANVGLNQAHIYRLIIDSNDTVQPVKKVPDIFFVNNGPSFLVNAGMYRSYIATDGASTFAMRSQYRAMPLTFDIFSAGLRSGLAIHERGFIPIDIDVHGARAIGPMIKSATTGQWLVVGDFGVRGNE